MGQIFSAIILAAAVAGATSIAGDIKAEKVEADFYNDIELCLSREYIEDILGHPRKLYVERIAGLTKCYYALKHSKVTIFYADNSVAGYFITLQDYKYKKVGTTCFVFSDGKPLCTFTFESLDGFPNTIRSNQVNMDYRYLEKYFLDIEDEYSMFYYIYMTKDGVGQYDPFTSEEEFLNDEIVMALGNDAVQYDINVPDWYDVLFINRNVAQPNTYGECTLQYADAIEECFLYDESY